MRSLRTHCLVLVLALVAGASACKKEGDGAAGGAGGGAGGAADDLNVVPANSDVVIGIDLDKLRSSALFKEFGDKLMSRVTGEISEFKETCGFDPVQTFKSGLLALKPNAGGDGGSGAFLAHTSASRDQLKACLEKSKAKAEADGTKITIDGDIAFLAPKDGKSFGAVTFYGSDGVVVMFKESAWTKEMVADVLKGAGSIKSSKSFLDARSAMKKDQTVWMYINGSAPMVAQASPLKLDAESFFGTINVTDGLSSAFRIRMKSDADAKAAEEALKGQMTSAQMFFTKAEMRADGKDLIIDADLSGSQLKGIASMVLSGMQGMGAQPAPGAEAASPQ
jgi:hypothetical protein